MVRSTPDWMDEPQTLGLYSLSDWHVRYCQQAGWTRDLRRYLYQRANLAEARRVLEVGCGTGAITADLAACSSADIHGLDFDFSRLVFSAQNGSGARQVCGDAVALPYPSSLFDVTCCHFLLLWVQPPVAALAEMRRVTRRGGAVLVLAEPDYGGRIDYPPELAALGRWQREALQRQGADPEIGRKLGRLLSGAGLPPIEMGVLGGQWGAAPAPEARALEWAVLQADLHGMEDPGQLREMQAHDEAAWQRGERVLYVPTFYAWSRVI